MRRLCRHADRARRSQSVSPTKQGPRFAQDLRGRDSQRQPTANGGKPLLGNAARQTPRTATGGKW
jgi:hypothetical protein